MFEVHYSWFFCESGYMCAIYHIHDGFAKMVSLETTTF